VHLNVDPGASHGLLFWRKCLWVVIGLFAPEIVLVRGLAPQFFPPARSLGPHLTANQVSSYEQWRQARSLHKKVRRRGEPPSEDVCSSTKNEDATMFEKMVTIPIGIYAHTRLRIDG